MENKKKPTEKIPNNSSNQDIQTKTPDKHSMLLILLDKNQDIPTKIQDYHSNQDIPTKEATQPKETILETKEAKESTLETIKKQHTHQLST